MDNHYGNFREARYQQLPHYDSRSNLPQPESSRVFNDQAPVVASTELNSNSSLDSTEDSYSESCSSSCSSSWSSDGSSVAEWESHVDSYGELFYVELGSPQTVLKESRKEKPADEDKQKYLKKKSMNRLAHLLKRRHRKQSPSIQKRSESPPYSQTESALHAISDWNEWTSYTIELEVHPLQEGTSSGRRNSTNLCESLLGFVPGTPHLADWHGEVSLRHRIVVDKLVANGPLHQGSAPVHQGDWLEKLNGHVVTHRELNDFLRTIQSRQIVELNFRRKPADQAQSKESAAKEETSATFHGVLLLNQEEISETASQSAQDVLFQSSTAGKEEFLKLRGIHLTLLHLLPQLNSSVPVSSTIVMDGALINVVYILEKSLLLMVAAPALWCSRTQLQSIVKQLELFLQLQYGSIQRAFSEQRFADEINRFIDYLFHYLRTEWSTSSSQFVHCFTSAGQWLPLPTECRLDVTLTLNQMEAMDYEDWDYNTRIVERCVTIAGSVVYYKGYLIASTLCREALQDLNRCLHWNQILNLTRRHRLKTLIIWREIFPQNNNGQRFFILAVASGHTLLATQLETGSVTQPWDNNPDAFLIEELQFYLEELHYLELEAACEEILNGPPNPVLVSKQEEPETKENPVTRFSITAGRKPTLITYFSLDCGTGMLIAPLQPEAGDRFLPKFQKTCLAIHKLFQQTLKSKNDLQSPDWGGPWSDKSLVALQEVSVLFSIPESSVSSGNKTSMKEISFWVSGRLFITPSHRELYVCYQDGIPQDLLDLAFHLGFAAVI